MSRRTSAHEHLGSDSAELAARRYLETGDLPECETCRSEVRELARYFSAGQLLGRRHADLPGTPAATAIRELRRRSCRRFCCSPPGMSAHGSPRELPAPQCGAWVRSGWSPRPRYSEAPG